jgi:hypothetical protein
MYRLETLWDRIERQAIYAVLFMLFLLQFAALFIPKLSHFMDNRGAIILIALSLLMVFRYLDERLGSYREGGIFPAKSLLSGVEEILSRNAEYTNVDILAHTSNVYYLGFQQSNVRVKHLRLLLRRMDLVEDIEFPASESDKSRIRQRLKDTVQEWQELANAGKIEHLSIGYYPFEPQIHYMLTDNATLLYGLYRIESRFPGIRSTVNDAFVADGTSNASQLMITNHGLAFESAWAEFGDRDSEATYEAGDW